MKDVTAYYSATEDSDTKNQTYLTLNYVTGLNTNRELAFALDMLTDVLVNLESAPVRLALQEAGIDPSSLPIFGLGGSKEGLKAIDEGLIFSTVLQSPIHETNLVATMAVEMVQKGFDRDDKWDPYYNFMDTPKIYKSNVAEYLPGDW